MHSTYCTPFSNASYTCRKKTVRIWIDSKTRDLFLVFQVQYSSMHQLPPVRFHCVRVCWDRWQSFLPLGWMDHLFSSVSHNRKAWTFYTGRRFNKREASEVDIPAVLADMGWGLEYEGTSVWFYINSILSFIGQDDNQLLPGEPVGGWPAHLCLVSLDLPDPPGARPHLPLHPPPHLLQAGRLLPRPLHRRQRPHPLSHLLRQVTFKRIFWRAFLGRFWRAFSREILAGFFLRDFCGLFSEGLAGFHSSYFALAGFFGSSLSIIPF